MDCRLPIADCPMKCDAVSGAVRMRFIRHSTFGIRQSAFTLVEVMISIAIALVLILGISQIFSLAQQATGAGNAVLASSEADRGVMPTLTQDFRTMVDGVNAPAIAFSSCAISAFRNRADMVNDADGNSATLNPNPGVGVTTLSYTQMNERIHRADKLCFFVRDHFTRQTANRNSPNLTSPTASNEAFVWLGHLSLPNNATIVNWNSTSPQSGTWFNPGELTPVPPQTGTNDNNLFASDWVLGREVIVMLPHPPGGESFFAGPPVTPAGDALSIFSASFAGIPLSASRYDLAGTDIDDYRKLLASRYTSPSATNWGWQNLLGYNGNAMTDPRYKGNPFPHKPPSGAPVGWMAAAAAQTYPVFVKGCTQFAVEYAGNFVTQYQDPGNANFGQVASANPDPTGKIDFIPVKDLSVNPPVWTRHIRWYGFPRDPNDEGSIRVTGPAGQFQSGVCPLRDTLLAAPNVAAVYPSAQYTAIANRAPNERAVPIGNYVAGRNYKTAMQAGSQSASNYYVCAWGPDTINFPQPKMIRITFAIDDPAGHLSTSQVYEYVFTLP